MEAGAVVGCAQTRGAALPPCGNDAVDGAGIEIRPVAEHDDGRLDVRPQRSEAAAERCSRPACPLGAVHRPGVDLHLVSAENDHDVADAALAQPLDDRAEEDALLRRPEPSGGARREDDGRNHARKATG